MIFFILGFGCFIVGMSSLGSPGSFFDAPSVIIVFAPTFLIAAAFYSPSGVLNALKTAVGTEPITPAEAQHNLNVMRTLRSLSTSSGIIGVLIGVVLMLANLDDPSKIGPAMAVALLSPLYGVMLAELIFRPMAHRIEDRTTLHTLS
ncbi:MAG: MotA/TolQ/ExbB proton channel family protein [Myxococcota bacterium]|nr:MotA/TolQ/ExbB proton channel family protein [Myxococcota bacterium]